MVELLVGLTIGAIVIGITVSASVVILKSNVQVKNFQIASSFSQDLMDKVRIISEAKWNDIYNLSPKGTSTNYFVIASGTGLAVISGREGMLGGDVRNGLVGHWKFDEATGMIVYDSSGNSNHGSIITGTSSINRVAGKVGDAINFDGGDDYVELVNLSALNFGTSSFSYGAWVKAAAVGPSPNNRVISKRNGTGPSNIGYDLAVGPTEGLRAELSDGSGEAIVELGSSINLNQWYFVMAVVDKSTNQFQLFIDGKQVSSVINNEGSLSNSFPLTFSRISTGAGGGEYFNGLIDDIRIYNRALSAAEVKSLYESGIFTRFFNVENVNRSGNDIVLTGGTDDPSTQKITSRTQWTAVDKTPEVKVATYITRWRNFIFQQLDWVGGSGQDGPFTTPGNVFSTSTNTDYTGIPGSLKVLGL